MTVPLASLSMYDWPEIRKATDRFWSALHDSLADAGFAPPEKLMRPDNPIPIGQSENLLIAQTCGLPYMEKLIGKVSLIGTPAYDVDCGAGSYFSVIAVHKDSGIEKVADLDQAKFGYNDPLSQSGVAAFFFHLASNRISPTIFSQCRHLNSHRNAIRRLAERHIDVASIDAVTWELAKRHEKAAEELRVIAQTDPTPGLPLITARRSNQEVDRIHHAVIAAIASLPNDVSDALLLTGLAATGEADYRLIKDRFESVRGDIESCLSLTA